MEDEIAALEVGGNHVLQQQRLVLGDRRPLQSVYLLLPGDQRVVGALLLGNRETADGADIRELPQVDLVEALGKSVMLCEKSVTGWPLSSYPIAPGANTN